MLKSSKTLLRLSILLSLGCPLFLMAQEPKAADQSGKAAEKAAQKPGAPGQTAPGQKDEVVGAPVDPKTYRIGAEDVLLIRVWREPDLTGPVAVRPDGKFSMPLAGEIEATGFTPEQVAQKVTEALGKFMNRPEVIVSVQSVNSKKYYIAGEVNRPGAYPLVVPTTVLQALTEAGGFRDFANTKKIIVMRGSERLRFNYKEVIKGKNPEQNVLLLNEDHIIVP